MILKDKAIFIVEDNQENIYVISLLLRHHGAKLRIDWWAKGEVSQLEKAMPIDLIILDLMLPDGRTGYDVFEEIRRFDKFADIPIVAVSAADHTIEAPKAIEKGFAGFISKPVHDELFPQQIRKLIDGEQVWDTYAFRG